MPESSIVVLVDLSAAHRNPRLVIPNLEIELFNCLGGSTSASSPIGGSTRFRAEGRRITGRKFLGSKSVGKETEMLLRCSVYWRLLLHDNKAIIHPCAARCARRKKLGLLQ